MTTPTKEPHALVVAMRGGRSYPLLCCHRCGQTITEVDGASVVYAPIEASGHPLAWPARILCRATGCEGSPTYRHWLAIELDEFLVHMLENLGVTDETRLLSFWREARERIAED